MYIATCACVTNHHVFCFALTLHSFKSWWFCIFFFVIAPIFIISSEILFSSTVIFCLQFAMIGWECTVTKFVLHSIPSTANPPTQTDCSNSTPSPMWGNDHALALTRPTFIVSIAAYFSLLVMWNSINPNRHIWDRRRTHVCAVLFIFFKVWLIYPKHACYVMCPLAVPMGASVICIPKYSELKKRMPGSFLTANMPHYYTLDQFSPLCGWSPHLNP